MRIVLNNRISGTKTNQQAWQFAMQLVDPIDTSMNRVAEITNQYFDFGAPPQSGGVADPGVGGGNGFEIPRNMNDA